MTTMTVTPAITMATIATRITTMTTMTTMTLATMTIITVIITITTMTIPISITLSNHGTDTAPRQILTERLAHICIQRVHS